MYDEIWNTFVSYKNICGAKTRIANGYAPERPIAKKMNVSAMTIKRFLVSQS